MFTSIVQKNRQKYWKFRSVARLTIQTQPSKKSRLSSFFVMRLSQLFEINQIQVLNYGGWPYSKSEFWRQLYADGNLAYHAFMSKLCIEMEKDEASKSILLVWMNGWCIVPTTVHSDNNNMCWSTVTQTYQSLDRQLRCGISWSHFPVRMCQHSLPNQV